MFIGFSALLHETRWLLDAFSLFISVAFIPALGNIRQLSPDIYYFQNTPEVTSAQLILSFSLTIIDCIIDYFCTEPLKPLVLHTPL